MRWISLFGFFTLAGAWLSAQPQRKPIPIPRDPPDIHPQYFPDGVFEDSLWEGSFRGLKERWYAKHLRSMDEPSLSEASQDTTLPAYRFLWLRTFHHPISVRLTVHADGTGTLNAKETDGHGGYETGKVVRSQSGEMAKTQMTEFFDLVRKAGFWSLPSEEKSSGLDGAQWVLEGMEDGHYHVVDRWSPPRGNYQRLCLYLLEQSKLKVQTKDIY